MLNRATIAQLSYSLLLRQRLLGQPLPLRARRDAGPRGDRVQGAGDRAQRALSATPSSSGSTATSVSDSVAAGRLPLLRRQLGRAVAHGAAALLRHLGRRDAAPARALLLPDGRQLLPAALHGADAAAVRDRRSRAVDLLVQRRRRQGLVAPAVGAPRAARSRPRSTTSTSATSTSRCSRRATAPTSRRGSMSSTRRAAVAALVAVVAIVATASRAGAAARTVTLLGVSGVDGQKLRASARERSSASSTSWCPASAIARAAERLGRRGASPEEVQAVARAIGADAIIGGAVAGKGRDRELLIAVREGATGRVISRGALRSHGPHAAAHQGARGRRPGARARAGAAASARRRRRRRRAAVGDERRGAAGAAPPPPLTEDVAPAVAAERARRGRGAPSPACRRRSGPSLLTRSLGFDVASAPRLLRRHRRRHPRRRRRLPAGAVERARRRASGAGVVRLRRQLRVRLHVHLVDGDAAARAATPRAGTCSSSGACRSATTRAAACSRSTRGCSR